MSDDRLTPEERAVIEAVTRWHRERRVEDVTAMHDAIAAYEASLRPQPVECLMLLIKDNWEVIVDDDYEPLPCNAVWRVTITPIEQVR